MVGVEVRVRVGLRVGVEVKAKLERAPGAEGGVGVGLSRGPSKFGVRVGQWRGPRSGQI